MGTLMKQVTLTKLGLQWGSYFDYFFSLETSSPFRSSLGLLSCLYAAIFVQQTICLEGLCDLETRRGYALSTPNLGVSTVFFFNTGGTRHCDVHMCMCVRVCAVC